MESRMFKTPRRQLKDGTWCEATFGLHKIGPQEPYMALTGAVWAHKSSTADRNMISCGQVRDSIAEAFPELAELAIFHLATDGVPMHYLANAKFWHECARGENRYQKDGDRERAPECFASTIAHGALGEGAAAGASVASLLGRPWTECEAILSDRLPLMRATFRALVARLPELATATGAEPSEY